MESKNLRRKIVLESSANMLKVTLLRNCGHSLKYGNIGGSLWNMIEKFGKLNDVLIRKFTTQVLLGLQYLHYHGIIHRDIKGANILVDPLGVCKLAGNNIREFLVSFFSAGLG